MPCMETPATGKGNEIEECEIRPGAGQASTGVCTFACQTGETQRHLLFFSSGDSLS